MDVSWFSVGGDGAKTNLLLSFDNNFIYPLYLVMVYDILIAIAMKSHHVFI